MQPLRCIVEIFHELVAHVHIYLSEGALASHEGVEVLIDMLPLGILLSRKFFEIGEEVTLHLLLVEEFIHLVDDAIITSATQGFCFLAHAFVIVTLPLVLGLGIDVYAE